MCAWTLSSGLIQICVRWIGFLFLLLRCDLSSRSHSTNYGMYYKTKASGKNAHAVDIFI